jgi:DNA-binding LytR/AlgR family response regulator
MYTSVSDKKAKFTKFPIATSEGFLLIEKTAILYLEADNTSTTFFLEDKSKVVSTRNIGYYDEELKQDPFIRIHHSYLVNLNKIVRYVRADNGYVVLANGKPLGVARGKKDELLSFFSDKTT